MKILKKFILALGKNKGSQLIEASGGIVIILTVLAFSLTVLPGFIKAQKLQHFATSLIRTAEVSGTTDIQPRIDRLKHDTNISPHTISWSGTAYIGTSNRVQLNDEIMLTITSSYNLDLLGFTTLTVPMSVNVSGASEVYFK